MARPAARAKTRTSIHGTWNDPSGFTLIELVVVVALIGLTLFVSLPRMRAALFDSSVNALTRQIANTLPQLRQQAIDRNQWIGLNIDMDRQCLWLSDAGMTAEALAQAAADAQPIDADMRLAAIEFPGQDAHVDGVAEIICHPQGYCDPARIFLSDPQGRQTLLVADAFIPTIQIVEDNEY